MKLKVLKDFKDVVANVDRIAGQFFETDEDRGKQLLGNPNSIVIEVLPEPNQEVAPITSPSESISTPETAKSEEVKEEAPKTEDLTPPLKTEQNFQEQTPVEEPPKEELKGMDQLVKDRTPEAEIEFPNGSKMSLGDVSEENTLKSTDNGEGVELPTSEATKKVKTPKVGKKKVRRYKGASKSAKKK